jgi:hypothetical protein
LLRWEGELAAGHSKMELFPSRIEIASSFSAILIAAAGGGALGLFV